MLFNAMWLKGRLAGAFRKLNGSLIAQDQNTTPWMFLVVLLLYILLVAYHGYCLVLIRRFRDGTNCFSERWYRWFNEFPSLILISVTILAVVRPF